VEALWKQEGAKCCQFVRNSAHGARGAVGFKRLKCRSNTQTSAVVHSSFDTAHNLKVTGSNPVPATKKLHHIKRLKASLTGGFLRSNTRGSTVEARGDEVFRRRDADKLLPLVRWSDRRWLTLRADKASGVQIPPRSIRPRSPSAPVPSRRPPCPATADGEPRNESACANSPT